MTESPARALPSVDLLLRQPPLAALAERLSRALVLDAARGVLEAARQEAHTSSAPTPDLRALVLATQARVSSLLDGPLRRVINASGVVIHTNLGRAPLSRAALAAVAQAAQGYLNLEYDLELG